MKIPILLIFTIPKMGMMGFWDVIFTIPDGTWC